jgi:hypothetical protein
MALRFERVVIEDLNLGTGKVRVSLPAGGTALGSQIHLDLLPAGLDGTDGTVLQSSGPGDYPSWVTFAELDFSALPVYANDTAAAALAAGTLYRTATGEVRVKL